MHKKNGKATLFLIQIIFGIPIIINFYKINQKKL